MLRAMYHALLRGGRRSGKTARPARLLLSPLVLEGRTLPAVFGLFTPAAGGTLAVFGDAADNAVTISRDVAGKIFVNNGAVTVFGGTPTVANTSSISVFGQAGNDAIALDEANGALPKAILFGGAGADTLTGGSGADQLFGQAGNDILLGKGGDDFLFGGAGNDALTAGKGNDKVFGEAGDDRMIWNPGDGSALNEGGAGNDTVEVNGGNVDETFTVVANGSRVRFDRVTPGAFSLDIGTSENLLANLNGGDDSFSASNGLAPLIQLTVDGGDGNDVLLGGDGADSLSGGAGDDGLIGGAGNDALFGGAGNDQVRGGSGNDVAELGAGDDLFVWNPGDGSDSVEGEDGRDILQFNGAIIGERFDVSANGGRVRFTRDIGTVTMDVNGTELINVAALEGADTITVGDLTGSGVTNVNVDLSGGAGTVGDSLVDQVIVNGTNGNDNVQVALAPLGFAVTGLPAAVVVGGVEPTDQLVVFGLAGDDTIDAHTVAANLVTFGADGGAGNDTLTGSDGADLLKGSEGNDLIVGGRGADRAELGDGKDTFVWNPGDGSDIVEGQAGSDSLVFNGADVAERFDISANGNRVLFSRDIGGIDMDLNGVEEIDVNALDGADTVSVNDLSATDLTGLNLDLSSTTGTGDGKADSVIINGTGGDDAFQITPFFNGNAVAVGGSLFPFVSIAGADGANDTLTLNTLAGDDVVDAASLPAGLIGLVLNGGAGNDTLEGGSGNDLVNGGTGADFALLGVGDDTFVWNPGDGSDSVEGQDGADTLQFNGANIAEQVDVAANGSRVRFTRDIAGITMDLNGVEQVNFNALGGVDTITVHDLTGTDVTAVNLNLGAADGSADTVIVEGTGGDDSILVTGDATGVTVSGLAATINVTGAEPANDRLTVNALAGDDGVNGSGLAGGTIQFTADGGDGDDILVGTPGRDTLLGGNGDDVLIGNGGGDVLDGGSGNNTLFP